MKFSIIVVALNAGDKLKQTVDSVLAQTCTDYEIVVKDGGSKDGSVDKLPKDDRIKVFVEKDTGIYDAMNQAVSKTQGEYILFLNCGDSFYDSQVLERAASCIDKEQGEVPLVIYGDTYGAKNEVMIDAPRKIDGFACYRNIPCHQSCFYAAKLCKEKPYRPEYRIRADYDHFLWCYYKAKAKMVYMGSAVASYEGGGYSESKENRKRDTEEHKLITEEYMEPKELAGYRRAMTWSMAPLRSFLAENRFTAGVYHWLKDCFYHHKLRIVLGMIFFVVELCLFMGTGVMLQEVVNFHSGEGSWEEAQTAEAPVFKQEFRPQYDHLHLVSFLMETDDLTMEDGTVILSIADKDGQVLFSKEQSVEEVKGGRFTDVEVDVELSAGKKYYLTLESTPSSAGEYPGVGVCSSKDYRLPETGILTHGSVMEGVQLVSRYHYVDAFPVGQIIKVIFISLITAFGVMFGLPRKEKVRKIAGVVLLIAVPCILGSRLELLTYKELFYMDIAMIWNVGIMLAVELLVLLCTHSPRVSILVTNIFMTILYSANFFVIMYRGTPLRMNDFSAIGTATKVVGDYSLKPDNHLAVAWGLLVLFVVFAVQTGTKKLEQMSAAETAGRKKMSVAKKLGVYGATIALAVVMGAFCFYQLTCTNLLNRVGFEDERFRGFYQDMVYYFDGYLVGTCIELKNSRITPLEGYSKEYVEQILTEASANQGEVSEELPHVILVMNESFADLRILENLEISEENMPFFKSLEENTVRGYVNASVIGGGTANSEFEVFTGCNTAFFSANYYPYQQAIKKPVNSLVSQMEKYGYTTYAMHPEPGTNWNRTNVYRHYGFDQTMFQKDFEGAEEIHSGVSDAETYKKVIELYENRKEGDKLFIFDLTMQNHGGYDEEEGPDEVVALNLQEPEVDEYLSLIKISDAAFEDLVGYFEAQDEKVVICMFGDHQPWVSDLILKTDKTDSSVAVDQLMKKYKTPFVIWANYDIEEADGYDISLNYLGGLLQRTAGIPLSPYFAFLEKQRDEFPIITVNGYVDSEGNYYNWGSTGDEFPQYRMLQYNYLYDDTVEWGY